MKHHLFQHSWEKIFSTIVCCILTIVLCSVMINCGDPAQTSHAESDSITISDTLKWSVRMAESEIYRCGDSLFYGRSNPGARWNYTTGLFLKSLLDLWQANGNDNYFNYVRNVIDSYLEEDGTIRTYKIAEYNIDKINSGKVLLTLYKETQSQVYKNAADLLYEQLKNHPRTSEGGFWHKKRYPWQMWLDGIYMGSPFYAEYSSLFNQTDGFDDVIKQILLIDVHTRDPKTKLRYHAWDSSNKQKWANPTTGCSPNFWGRAMGWYAMALVDVLDFIPQNHRRREQIIFIINDMAKAITNYQDKQSGLWYQVLDQGGRQGNYLEASASAMFVYFMAKAVRMDYINPENWQVANDGYNGLLRQLISVEANGLVSLNNICAVAGLGGKPYRDGSYEYYLSEPVVSNDLKGIGPFIMASLQMEEPPMVISGLVLNQ